VISAACIRAPGEAVSQRSQATLDGLWKTSTPSLRKALSRSRDEWRNESTLDEIQSYFSKAARQARNRSHAQSANAREEQTSTAPIKGHSVVIVYQTIFERGEAWETLTLLEHGGQWYLARYFASSKSIEINPRIAPESTETAERRTAGR